MSRSFENIVKGAGISAENISSSRITMKELEGVFLLDQAEETTCPFTAMWRAVLTQALMDAGSNAKKLEARREKARAIAWLNGNSDDFREVCIMADYDPDYVRSNAMKAIKNGCKWREEANVFLKKKKTKKIRKSKPKLEFKCLERIAC